MAQTGAAVRLYGPDSKPLDVQNGVAVPAGTSALIPAVVDPTGSLARFIRGDALGRPDTLMGSWLGSQAPTVGQKPMADSLPVTIASNQTSIPVSVGLLPGILALPTLVNLAYGASDGAVAANRWKEVLAYTVPANYNGYVLKFASYQAEAASSRLAAEIVMGNLSIVTNTWTPGSNYVAPQFSANPYAVVTTMLSSGSGDVIVTVTYTNQYGVAARTGTFTIPKGSNVGYAAEFVYQAGDIGVRSIQAVSVAPTLAAGHIEIHGLTVLALHQDQSTTQQSQTIFAPGAISFPTGTILVMYYNGGTVSKFRSLDALIQLVAI